MSLESHLLQFRKPCDVNTVRMTRGEVLINLTILSRLGSTGSGTSVLTQAVVRLTMEMGTGFSLQDVKFCDAECIAFNITDAPTTQGSPCSRLLCLGLQMNDLGTQLGDFGFHIFLCSKRRCGCGLRDRLGRLNSKVLIGKGSSLLHHFLQQLHVGCRKSNGCAVEFGPGVSYQSVH